MDQCELARVRRRAEQRAQGRHSRRIAHAGAHFKCRPADRTRGVPEERQELLTVALALLVPRKELEYLERLYASASTPARIAGIAHQGRRCIPTAHHDIVTRFPEQRVGPAELAQRPLSGG